MDNVGDSAKDLAIDSERRRVARARFVALLAGAPAAIVPETPENGRLFNTYSSEDRLRAQFMAGLCGRIADRIGGLAGLEAAIDELYRDLATSPKGMVMRAALLFSMNCASARDLLREEAQPGAHHQGPCPRP